MMTSIRNFRDFGGYRGAGGRRVRRGVFFRSGHLAQASEGDVEKLNALGIVLQADLRRPDERENEPGRWQAARTITSDLGRQMRAPHLEFLNQLESADPALAEEWMRDYYRKLPYRSQHCHHFTDWFATLFSPSHAGAALVNCTAGKDRTGVLCALTQWVLGVHEDDVMEDYLFTNQASDVEARLPAAAAAFNARLGRNHSVEVYRPFLGVRAVYLRDSLAAIRQTSGSLEAYLETTLGVTPALREGLCERFLEG